MSTLRQVRISQFALILLSVWIPRIVVDGFSSPTTQHRICGRKAPLFSSVEDKPQTSSVNEDEEDGPAGIGGAEFFGGNKQKEELYDPVAEREAGKGIELKATSYNRFSLGVGAFDSVEVASMAQSLQAQINEVLYSDNKKLNRLLKRNQKDSESDQQKLDFPDVNFGRSLSWDTPMTVSSTNPFEEIRAAKNFYQNIDLAIVGGRRVSEGVSELSWELSVVWPTFWSPRVVLSGSSTVTTASDKVTITKQVDRIFGADNNAALLSLLGGQITPRFWDWYHIGMTPSAEQVPRKVISQKGGMAVYQIPPQLVTAPSLIETGTRDNRNAQMVPNHSFTCVIRTMGPKDDRDIYVPTTPIEVKIGRNDRSQNDNAEDGKESDDRLLLSWSIPLSTQFQALNKNLLLPAEDDEDAEEGAFPECNYVWQPLRQVATIKYGGNVQDEEISGIRKKLYEQVMKEGLKPKLDEAGKPKFFFWQNDVKACYIEDGLGMVVYDWRPEFANSNEVGIELMV
ncbi:unnamed protein product [Pseudo-nitzschia multistriata]|uniref:Uncharacterized protein n=1 Tax=Pseudo-nitzschia multistriata TaxID=183589 RepID=A0A448ZIM8_9STRA|nr:unnamed protein product [Pseudo-nitzschia multistriata]